MESGATTFEPIPGANEITFSDTANNSVNESASYRLVVSSGDCNITTEPVVLNIFDPSLPVILSGDATYPVGGTGVTLTAPPGFTYEWSRAGETTAFIENVLAGTYTVTLTNGTGCSIVSEPFTVTEISLPPVGDPCADLTFVIPTDQKQKLNTDAPIALTFGSPNGGVYEGPGVIDNGDGTYDFDPSDATAVLGDNLITYSLSIDAVFSQIGQKFDGQETFQDLGKTVRINDPGNVIAMSSPRFDSDFADGGGLVKVYALNDLTNVWEQRGTSFLGIDGGNSLGGGLDLNNTGDRGCVYRKRLQCRIR